MSIARLVLDYLGVLLSWPVMVFALGLVFLIRFRASLEYLLRNIGSIKLPGGAEILAQLPVPPEEDTDADTAVDELPDTQRELVDALLSQLEAQQAQAMSEQEQREQTFRQLQWAALYWEFMYLSKFLVPKTQWVLKTLRTAQPPLTRTAFNHYWPLWQFGGVTEREAVFSALTTTGLVQEDNSVLKVTPKGDAFVQFVGGV